MPRSSIGPCRRLTITAPSITAGAVQVAEQRSGAVVGVVSLMLSPIAGIARLGSMFVDPPSWRQRVGRTLFGAAVDRTRTMKAGAVVISSAPSAEGFYMHMGAVKIGQAPFYFSPEVILPTLLYIVPNSI
jgi:predicted N-acetyltransferase YhbS